MDPDGSGGDSPRSVLRRALCVLDAFNYRDRDVSLSELARRTGLPKVTVLRIARELVRWAPWSGSTAVGTSSGPAVRPGPEGAARGPRDLEQLLLGRGQLADPNPHVDGEAELVEHRGSGTVDGPSVQQTEASGIGPREQVLGHAEIREQAQLLGHYGDAGALGRDRAGERGRLPADLEVVLGVARATVLRRLDVPLTMGAVAHMLVVTPAAATRHCDVLVRAGLITRERRGKAVHVTRTDRGGDLLELLG